jgi:hypothetical protein
MSAKTHKKIVWSSWNALAEEYIQAYHNEIDKMEEELANIKDQYATYAIWHVSHGVNV